MGSRSGRGPVRVYLACSVDGFIAGPDDDLSWLPDPTVMGGFAAAGALGFEEHLAEMGALLMGRRTWDVVSTLVDQMGSDSPYGEVPILVATTRPLEDPPGTVRAVSGPVERMVAEAKTVAGMRGVYLDGGLLVRSALREGLVDELVLTVVPVLLGGGTRLFDETVGRHRMEPVGVADVGDGIVQLRYRVRRPDPAGSAGPSDGGSSRMTGGK